MNERSKILLKKKLKRIVFLSALFSASLSCATPLPAARALPADLSPAITDTHPDLQGFYMLASLGLGRMKLGETKTIHFTPTIAHTYISDTRQLMTDTLGIEGGYLWPLSKSVRIALGASANYFSSEALSGQVWHYQSPELHEVDYRYHIDSDYLLAKTKLMFPMHHMVPYISAGLGWSWNEAHHYEEHAIVETGVPTTAPFTAHTEEHFAYEIGAGLGYLFTNVQVLCSIEYRYLNLGDARLGRSLAQTTSDRLATGNIHSNLFVLTLTKLF